MTEPSAPPQPPPPLPNLAGESLAEQYIVPPFSVINAREGGWQDRKAAWLATGIRSELGRGASPGGSPLPAASLKADGTTQRGDGAGHAIPGGGTEKPRAILASSPAGDGVAGYKAVNKAAPGGSALPLDEGQGGYTSRDKLARAEGTGGNISEASGTSIFDPVLTELSYWWFCPPGGEILDPFAGGSVRGLVAAWRGYQYYGVDLRAEQLEANRGQLGLLPPGAPIPRWFEGDSTNLGALFGAGTTVDYVFSCPPYADLERYSDDPRDLSTLDYPAFREGYARAIKSACDFLAPDRFATFVVGEVRDKKTGGYYGFVPDTIRAFEAAGLRFYNEVVLVTAVGSLSLRAPGQFAATRKVGKTHQNVLTFLKGDARRAAEVCHKNTMTEVNLLAAQLLGRRELKKLMFEDAG